MKKIGVIFAVLLIFSISCKKTVESEKRLWDVSLREANELKFEYPAFSNVINDQIKTAELVMNQVQGINDEKLKIQRMSEANNQLNTGFIRNLKEIKSIKYSIRTKTTEIRSLKLDFNDISASNQTISMTERLVFDSDIKLKSIVNNRNDADALSSLVLADLKSGVSNLEKIISRAKEKENLEKKKTEQLAADKAAADKKKTEAAQPIKCQYCGTLNLATATICKSCGASLKK